MKYFFSCRSADVISLGVRRTVPYEERCDANGNPTTTGEPNCIDLGRYLFVYSPVIATRLRSFPTVVPVTPVMKREPVSLPRPNRARVTWTSHRNRIHVGDKISKERA